MMTKFLDFLVSYLSREFWESASASQTSQFRACFKGPPQRILNAMFDHLVAGRQLETEVSGPVPVFLLDPNAQDPSVIESARCSRSYLVNVRTSECRYFLALLPFDDDLTLSSSSTLKHLGSAADQTTDFIDEPLTQAAVREALRDCFSSDQFDERALELVRLAMAQATQLDQAGGQADHQWALLERLFEAAATESGWPALLAATGMPSAQPDGTPSPRDYSRALSRLAAELENRGFSEGLANLSSATDDPDVRDALHHAVQHIRERCVIPSRFAEAPCCFYFPTRDDSGALPDWWHRLRVDVLQQLFDVTDPAPATLQVECINPLIAQGAGLPAVVQSAPAFRVSFPEDEEARVVTVWRGKTIRNRAVVGSIDPKAITTPWIDASSIPSTNGPIKYWFSADRMEESSARVIVLDAFEPGVVIHARTADSVQLFRRPKAKRTAHTPSVAWECEIHLNGVGTHQLDLFTSSSIRPEQQIIGYEINSEQDGEVRRPINESGPNHWTCLIETDEECTYSFTTTDAASNTQAFRVLVRATEETPVDVESEFDRLVAENRNRASGRASSTRTESPNNRLKDLQRWIFEEPLSFAPLWFGSDYQTAWHRPRWPETSPLTSLATPLDVRPALADFLPPTDLRTCRAEILNIFRGLEGGTVSCLEDVRLGELMRDSSFRTLIERYVGHFNDWLARDYERAAWMDVVAISFPDETGLALEPYPTALLLSPLHPLRLGWQCHAQDILSKALDIDLPCPAASILDPSTFPDCLTLPCRSASGQLSRRRFISVRGTSDYWAVLWSVDKMSRCGSALAREIFSSELGLRVEGLSPGFSVPQVTRSLDEVASILPARTTLRTAVLSDTKEPSPINDGIADWSRYSLGPSDDPWFSAGPRGLEVIDTRDPSEQPDEAFLGSICRLSGDAISWYSADPEDSSIAADLAIVAHLSSSAPEFQTHNLRSILDPNAVLRHRIRKLVGSLENRFIAESRIAISDHSHADDILAAAILDCTSRLENSCSDLFDSHVAAPRLVTLDRALRMAEYCALTASNVDPACFLGSNGPTYLWDYELPSYSRRAGHNEGYYLLARSSPRMARAVSTATAVLTGSSTGIDDASIARLLNEASKRGVPTLKKLTSGGSASLGEIGTLIALRLLQTELCMETVGPGLIPVIGGSRHINIVVPVDPFIEHIKTFRAALGSPSAERPDLLVISVLHDNESVCGFRLTPIEVKARHGTMVTGHRKAALAQASEFGTLLKELIARADKTTLWSIAWTHFIAAMVQYGFRVYGQSIGMGMPDVWTRIYASAIQKLSTRSVPIEIDSRGRLFLVDASPISATADIDEDGFEETIVLSQDDANAVLLSTSSDTRTQLVQRVANWELQRPDTEIERKPLTKDAPTGTAISSPAFANPTPPPHSPPQPTGSEGPVGQPESPPDDHVTEGVKFQIGTATDTIARKPFFFHPSNTSLSQLNVGIVGNLGTGKTQLIQALMYQLSRSANQNRGVPPRVLIFDYKKDYSKADFVHATNARVIEPYRIPLNLFDVSDCSGVVPPWLQRARFFIDVLGKIYSGIGAVQKVRLKEAIKRAYESAATAGRSAPTIGEVFEEYANEIGDDYDTPYSIMSDLVDQELFVPAPEGVLPFSEFLKGVVVINLGALGQDDNTKNMLVAIFLNLFYEHMLKVEKRPFLGSEPQLRFLDSFILVDEADNIMKYEFEVLSKILLQGREFGTGVILASQYMSHFVTRNKNYQEPLLTWFVHQVPNITVRELEGIGLTRVGSEATDRIKTLRVHECLYKSLGVEGRFIRATPFYELRNGE